MQSTAIDRRSGRAPRVPLDDVLIQLSHADWDEPFEADGVDVGRGGLSMRAPILPDVGSHLRCRFASPSNHEVVDADCEVVWAKDSGPRLGQFGLRFTGLDELAAEAIDRLVASWEDLITDHGVDDEESIHGPELVSLRLDGVKSAVVAEVSVRAGDALVVEQPLPFLRVGTGVAEEATGRRGHLSSVDLRLEGDTPRLVLTVLYDEPLEESGELPMARYAEPEAPPASASKRLEALAEDTFDEGPDLASPGMDEAEDDDEAYEASAPAFADEPDDEEALAEERPAARFDVADDDEEDAFFEPPAVVVRRRDDEARVVDLRATPSEAEEPSAEDEDAKALEALRPAGAAAIAASVMARGKALGPHVERLRTWLLVAWSRALPVLKSLAERARHGGEWLRQNAGPTVRELWARARRLGGRFASVVSERIAARRAASGASRRRTTRMPPGATNVMKGQRTQERPASEPRRGRRTLTLSLLAFGGVAFAVWALTPGDASVAEDGAPRLKTLTGRDKGVTAPSAPVGQYGWAVPSDPEAGEMGGMAADAEGVGPMAEPTFPSLGDARPQAPGGSPPRPPTRWTCARAEAPARRPKGPRPARTRRTGRASAPRGR